MITILLKIILLIIAFIIGLCGICFIFGIYFLIKSLHGEDSKNLGPFVEGRIGTTRFRYEK